MELHLPIDTAQAIQSLHPTAEFTTGDNKVTNWFSESITQPTESEITAEQTRLTNLYNSQQYQRNRAAEYPSIEDQLDDIYHNGIDAWKATIKTTKDKYPKPS